MRDEGWAEFREVYESDNFIPTLEIHFHAKKVGQTPKFYQMRGDEALRSWKTIKKQWKDEHAD